MTDTVDMTALAAVGFVVAASAMLLLLYFLLNKVFFFVLVRGRGGGLVGNVNVAAQFQGGEGRGGGGHITEGRPCWGHKGLRTKGGYFSCLA